MKFESYVLEVAEHAVRAVAFLDHIDDDLELFARKDKVAQRFCSILSSLARISSNILQPVPRQLPTNPQDRLPQEEEDA